MTNFSKRTTRLLALTPLAMAMALSSVHAAERVDLSQRNLQQLKQGYDARVSAQGVAAMAHSRHAQLLGMDADSRLVLVKRNNDLGKRNTRYQQTFRGIPIFGESVVVSENANTGEVEALFGRQVNQLQNELPATAPKMSSSQALALAKHIALGSRQLGMQIRNESSEQMIYIDDAGRAHMTYVVSFFADSPRGGTPTRPLMILDADNGRVLKQLEYLQHVESGTGPGGNEKIGQYEYGTDFGFLDVTVSGSTCTMNSPNVATYNLNGGTNFSGKSPYSYTCPRNTFKTINGGYAPLNDAHYFGNVVYNMYDDYMDAAPLSYQLKLGVHYGTNHDNAYWTGTDMLFGDGLNTFYPLVSLDVIGHEVSHGYTDQNSDLNYDSGQSGGMNEAFSDIAGEAAEFFMRGTNDFLVGAQIVKSGGALRYMCNPTQDGRSIDHASKMPAGGLNNHLSSGVYNKAFCTLAKTQGWTTKTAFQAFARANRDYWTASSNWAQGACGVQRAAADMGMNVQQVAAAFAVVGVTASGTNCGTDGGGGEPPTPTPGVQTYTNGTDVAIRDFATVESAISVSGRTGNAPSSSTVAVNIVHTYIGDLKVDLVAPDGSVYVLHNRTGSSTDNINKTFTVNLSSEALNGSWKLRVNDGAGGDIGRIDTWSITF